jgi:hypothetical protein
MSSLYRGKNSAQALRSVTSVLKNTKILYNLCSEKSRFRHCRRAQGIKWSNHGRPSVISTIGEENDCLETRARSARSVVDPTDGHEVLWGHSVGPVPITVRYHVRFPTALLPQQQLWHLHRFVAVQLVDIHNFRMCHTSRLKQALLQLSTCIRAWITLNRIMQGEIPCISTNSTITGTKGEEHVTVFVARVFHNHPLTTAPCCTFRTITPNKSLYLRDKYHGWKPSCPIWR